VSVDRLERESLILDQLAKDGSLSVSVLSQDLGVSEVTVRSHLRDLERRGLLTRTHGGAKPSSIQNVLARRAENAEAKERIAAAAAELVRDHDRIMIEAGTTTALIIQFLVGRVGVQVVTNSTLVFNQARLNPELTVILTGGTFHRQSESLVGPSALRTIRDYNVRLAFIGTDGFTVERGLTTQFAEGAEVIAAMHDRADETWLLADSSKYGRSGFVSVLPIDQITGIITDRGISPKTLANLTDNAPLVRTV
jgi:DeoR family galactitol utilization operon repressor